MEVTIHDLSDQQAGSTSCEGAVQLEDVSEGGKEGVKSSTEESSRLMTRRDFGIRSGVSTLLAAFAPNMLAQGCRGNEEDVEAGSEPDRSLDDLDEASMFRECVMYLRVKQSGGRGFKFAPKSEDGKNMRGGKFEYEDILGVRHLTWKGDDRKYAVTPDNLKEGELAPFGRVIQVRVRRVDGKLKFGAIDFSGIRVPLTREMVNFEKVGGVKRLVITIKNMRFITPVAWGKLKFTNANIPLIFDSVEGVNVRRSVGAKPVRSGNRKSRTEPDKVKPVDTTPNEPESHSDVPDASGAEDPSNGAASEGEKQPEPEKQANVEIITCNAGEFINGKFTDAQLNNIPRERGVFGDFLNFPEGFEKIYSDGLYNFKRSFWSKASSEEHSWWLYSLEGDTANLPKITSLADEYQKKHGVKIRIVNIVVPNNQACRIRTFGDLEEPSYPVMTFDYGFRGISSGEGKLLTSPFEDDLSGNRIVNESSMRRALDGIFTEAKHPIYKYLREGVGKWHDKVDDSVLPSMTDEEKKAIDAAHIYKEERALRDLVIKRQSDFFDVNLKRLLEESNERTIILNLGAKQWCPVCDVLEPLFESVAALMNESGENVKFASIEGPDLQVYDDVAEHMYLKLKRFRPVRVAFARDGRTSAPSILVLRKGKVVKAYSGIGDFWGEPKARGLDPIKFFKIMKSFVK